MVRILYIPAIGDMAGMVEGYLNLCFTLYNDSGNASVLKLGKNGHGETAEWFADFELPAAQRASHLSDNNDELNGQEVSAIRIYMRITDDSLISEECIHDNLLGDDDFQEQHARGWIFGDACFEIGIEFNDEQQVILFFERQNSPHGPYFQAILGYNADE